jgi:hypothetical protein
MHYWSGQQLLRWIMKNTNLEFNRQIALKDFIFASVLIPPSIDRLIVVISAQQSFRTNFNLVPMAQIRQQQRRCRRSSDVAPQIAQLYTSWTTITCERNESIKFLFTLFPEQTEKLYNDDCRLSDVSNHVTSETTWLTSNICSVLLFVVVCGGMLRWTSCATHGTHIWQLFSIGASLKWRTLCRQEIISHTNVCPSNGWWWLILSLIRPRGGFVGRRSHRHDIEKDTVGNGM